MRAVERTCPTCRSLIVVTAGRVEEHRAMFGRIVRGVHVTDRCPASSRSYARLISEVYPCAL